MNNLQQDSNRFHPTTEQLPIFRSLGERDLRMFRSYKIPLPLLDRAGVVRVSDYEARHTYGINSSGDNSGLIYPYFSRHDGHRVTCRLRRDNVEIENGKPKNKYLCPYGDRRHLYFVRGVNYADPDALIVLPEAEKSALALAALAERTGLKIAPIATGGCWGFWGRIGKVETSNGQRVDERGPLSDLEICRNRDVVVMLDSNVAGNPKVRAAERELSATLVAMDAKVRIARVPEAEGVNGPDDLIALMGDEAMRLVLDGTRLATECTIDDAETLIRSLKDNKDDTDSIREGVDAIAGIPYRLERERLQGKLSVAVRGVISKETIVAEVAAAVARRKQQADELARELAKMDLLSRPVNPRELVANLERFYADRMYLSEGTAKILAYFTENTHTFDVFDTTPDVDVESATKRCGKTTLLKLFEAVCARAFRATSFTGPALFRKVDQDKGTLLIDEAEVLEENSDRGKELRAICHDSYKKGAKTLRVEGENRELREFDVYGPKVFALIGGLTGPLLDRSIPIHLERAPHGHKRKSTRVRPLKRAAAPLVEQLKAYALQAKDELTGLYDEEPDEGYWPWLEDREAEIFGPLLYHARAIGPDAERDLVEVVKRFTQAKAEIESGDSSTAKAIAVLECQEAMQKKPPDTDARFAPGDLLAALLEYEAWASTFGKVKGADEKTRWKGMAARIGYFLKSFRLVKEKGAHRIEYNLQNAIDVIRRHVPQKPSEASEPSASTSQDVENNGVGESDTFAEGSEKQQAEPQNYRQGKTRSLS